MFALARNSFGSRWFSEAPEAIRRLVLLVYATVGPAFLLSSYLLSHSDEDRSGLAIGQLLLVLSGASWVALRTRPSTLGWIYPVSVVPTLCCVLAVVGCRQMGFAILLVMIAPSI